MLSEGRFVKLSWGRGGRFDDWYDWMDGLWRNAQLLLLTD